MPFVRVPDDSEGAQQRVQVVRHSPERGPDCGLERRIDLHRDVDVRVSLALAALLEVLAHVSGGVVDELLHVLGRNRAAVAGGADAAHDLLAVVRLALAVLLLPLPRTIAETLSLAGWIPSGRASLADLGRRWDVIAVPPHLVEQAHRQEPADDQGWPLAKALLELQPERAVLVPSVPVQAAGSSARPPAEPPVAVHTLPLTPLEAVRPDARIALPAPPKGSPGYLEALHAFACSVEARWLDLSTQIDALEAE